MVDTGERSLRIKELAKSHLVATYSGVKVLNVVSPIIALIAIPGAVFTINISGQHSRGLQAIIICSAVLVGCVVTWLGASSLVDLSSRIRLTIKDGRFDLRWQRLWRRKAVEGVLPPSCHVAVVTRELAGPQHILRLHLGDEKIKPLWLLVTRDKAPCMELGKRVAEALDIRIMEVGNCEQVEDHS